MECKHIVSFVKINREQVAHFKSNSQEFSNCKGNFFSHINILHTVCVNQSV